MLFMIPVSLAIFSFDGASIWHKVHLKNMVRQKKKKSLKQVCLGVKETIRKQ